MQSCAGLDLNCLKQFLPFSADVNTSASPSGFSRGSLYVSNKKRKQSINTEHEHQRERNVKIEKLKFGQFLCHELNTHNGTKTNKKFQL